MIKQRNLKDCAICSLAMFLDLPYAEIKRDVISHHAMQSERRFTGTTDETEMAILWKYGAKIKAYHQTELAMRTVRGKWVAVKPKRINFKKVIGKKRAIISVPSLNFKDFGHAIFWDGKKLYDPSNLKKYTAEKAFRCAYRAVVQRK